MPLYDVSVREHIVTVYQVEAESAEDALDQWDGETDKVMHCECVHCEAEHAELTPLGEQAQGHARMGGE